MPPKRRSARKVASPAKVSEVILTDKEEKKEEQGEEETLGEGESQEQGEGESQELLGEDGKEEGEGEEEVEKEENTVDLTSDQEFGEDGELNARALLSWKWVIYFCHLSLKLAVI